MFNMCLVCPSLPFLLSSPSSACLLSSGPCPDSAPTTLRCEGICLLTECFLYSWGVTVTSLWLGLVQGDACPSWPGGMTVSGRYGGRGRKVRPHIFNHKHDAERESWKWGWGCEHSKPIQPCTFSSTGASPEPPQSAMGTKC